MARKVGQIIARGDRRWLIRVYLGRDHQTNKRKYHNRTIHGPIREAQAYLTKRLRERDLGRDLEGAQITLNEYLDRWFETSVKTRVREKTCQDYYGMLRRYVRPQLGDRVLAALRPLDLQTVYQQMMERGLSARSVRCTHAILRSAMRPSEYLGLKWQDIEWVRQTVGVVRSLRRVNGRWCFADTKRTRSRRPIKLQNWIVIVLRELQRATMCATGIINPCAEAMDLILRTASGRPINADGLAKNFKSILEQAGLPRIRLYDLRHTAATLARAAGVSPKVVSEQLGHGSTAFTLDTYAHVLPHMQDEAAAKVEAMPFGHGGALAA